MTRLSLPVGQLSRPADIAGRVTRRRFFDRVSDGLGGTALAWLFSRDLFGGSGLLAEESVPQQRLGVYDVTPKDPPSRPRAKAVIQLFMQGGPSQMDLLDPKPKLNELHGEGYFDKVAADLTGPEQAGKLFRSPWRFRQYGESGLPISELLPHLGTVADEMCIIRSMKTEAINHDPAHTFMNTGTTISGRPSMGAWLTYGLGAETDNLPGFVVLTSVGGGQNQPIASRQWHSGFLPSRFQGVHFHSKGDPVLYVKNPAGVTRGRQRDVITAIQKLNQLRNDLVEDREISTRISQYELAFRMQASVPKLIDISDEPKHVLDLYGTKGGDGSFAANCLLARRLAERGVRFVQLYHRGWDHHGNIKAAAAKTAKLVDQPAAALLKDLKQRDMLKDTLVVWAGEFGRTPMAQGSGRDHHIKGFSIWMAGGGIKGGTSYGNTDELGYNAVENVVTVHDVHATMLRLLGIDHRQLTFPFQGRDFRLTDVAGNVIKPILA